MAFTITIAGVDVSAYRAIKVTGLPVTSITRAMRGGRATAAFGLFDKAQAYTGPKNGQAVVISDGFTTFSGIIDKFTAKRIDGRDTIGWSVTCTDYVDILKRRFVSRFYPQGSVVSVIFEDIVANFLGGDGFTTTHVDGFTALGADMSLTLVSVEQVFNRLSDLSGEQWWLVGKDIYSKGLSAVPETAFDLTDTSANWNNLEVEYARDGPTDQYSNRQWLRTNINLQAGAFVETYTANGIQWGFATRFPVIITPTLTVSGVAQTVLEIGDPGSAAGWYYIKGGIGVFYGPMTPPGAGTVIVITYGAFLTNHVMVENIPAQTARAAIEGGSGIYERVAEVQNVKSITEALALASGELNRALQIPVIAIKYETGYPINPGARQTVILAANNINTATSPVSYFYVGQVQSTAQEVAFGVGNNGQVGAWFKHSVTLSSGRDMGNYLTFWSNMWDRGAKGDTIPLSERAGWNPTGELILTNTLARLPAAPIHYKHDGYFVGISVGARVGPSGQGFEFDIRKVSDGTSILSSASPEQLPVLVNAGLYTHESFANSPQPCSTSEMYELWGRYTTATGSPASPVNAQDVVIIVEVQH